MQDIEQIKSRLKAQLKPERYIHTLGVADTARKLAISHGADPEKAYLAGLLHDCAKPYADNLSHAAMGAELAMRDYGVTDTEILDAIRYHTTGRAGMSLLEKIIYISDFIEPSRAGYEGLDWCRKLAPAELDKAVALCAKLSLDYLRRKGAVIDEATVEAYNYYSDL